MNDGLRNFNSLGFAFAPASPDHFSHLINPWVSEQFDLDDPVWRKLTKKKSVGIKRKYYKRKLLSSLGLAMPVGSHRTKTAVADAYDRIWSDYDWPQPVHLKPLDKMLLATWRDKGVVTRPGGTNQCHLDVLMTVIENLKPRSVLEVGSGAGRNLFALATTFPDIRFSGIELTRAGHNTSRSIQDLDTLPKQVACFNPRRTVDLQAHKTIDFRIGDATKLEFADNSFDLVFSRQALEQMEAIKHLAVPEMARVARCYAVLIEPFADYNTTSLQKMATKKKNHFSSGLADLKQYGLDLLGAFGDWPNKIDQGIGIAVARPTQ